MKHVIFLSTAFTLFMSLGISTALASEETPVGLVEELAEVDTDLEEFDYVYKGQTIDLGTDGEIVLSYFSSCKLERLKGGSVQIGQLASQTTGELLDQQTLECDNSQLVVSNDATESAVFVFRGSKDEDGKGIKLYSTLPAIKVTRPITYAQINRIDITGENWLITV